MLVKMDCANAAGGGYQVASGAPSSLTGGKVTTVFKPKIIMCAFAYTSNGTMACYYNADDDPGSYKRIYQATTDTQQLPNSNTGIVSVDDDGFTMNPSSLSNFTYIALG